ncbi:MAG: endonuclease/exonuclease/phosphatase family protein [Kineosporiaceae bacterium]
MRLVSWNIRDLSGDPIAVQRVLRALAADVLCLQEAPRRPGASLRIAALARACGLHHVTGGRGSGGTALLVAPRVHVRAAQTVRLPVPRWYTRTRGAVLAEVSTAGTAVALACVHLPLTPEQRLEHARSVRSALDAWSPGPARVVVAGDFNEPTGSPSWQVFSDLVRDPAPEAPPTFPARRPSGRIDAVLVGAGLDVLEYGDGGVDHPLVHRASDHLPVLAVLQGADLLSAGR